MKSRLNLSNGSHFVQWEDNPTGLSQAKAFRRDNPQFKGRRIKPVIQALPAQIKCGVIYEYI